MFGLVFFDPSERIDKLHLTRKEGVTLAADVRRDISFGRASCKTGTTSALDSDLVVVRVGVRLHDIIISSVLVFCQEDAENDNERGDNLDWARELS